MPIANNNFEPSNRECKHVLFKLKKISALPVVTPLLSLPGAEKRNGFFLGKYEALYTEIIIHIFIKYSLRDS